MESMEEARIYALGKTRKGGRRGRVKSRYANTQRPIDLQGSNNKTRGIRALHGVFIKTSRFMEARARRGDRYARHSREESLARTNASFFVFVVGFWLGGMDG